eukprot:scaffold5051_cov74-Cyclotella_meneghiniana.AAC.3
MCGSAVCGLRCWLWVVVVVSRSGKRREAVSPRFTRFHTTYGTARCDWMRDLKSVIRNPAQPQGKSERAC